MDIFTTPYAQRFHDTVRALNFKLLQKLAGANAVKFEILRPIVSGLPMQLHEQERKAYFVKCLIDILLAGANFNDLPNLSDCGDLSGNLCDQVGSDFTKLINDIEASQPTLVSLTTPLVAATVNYSFTIPAGRELVAATVLSPAGLTNTSIHVASISGRTGAITVRLDEAPTASSAPNLAASSILVVHGPIAQ